MKFLLALLLFAGSLFSLHAHPQRYNLTAVHEVHAREGFLIMQDGTRWNVPSPKDVAVLEAWQNSRVSFDVEISPVAYWFTGGHFYLTNTLSGDAVRADIDSEPSLVAFGPHAHWITYIDPLSGHFSLEDGSSWCIDTADLHRLRFWRENDHLIFGKNRVYPSPYSHIIINIVDPYSFIRARMH